MVFQYPTRNMACIRRALIPKTASRSPSTIVDDQKMQLAATSGPRRPASPGCEEHGLGMVRPPINPARIVFPITSGGQKARVVIALPPTQHKKPPPPHTPLAPPPPT